MDWMLFWTVVGAIVGSLALVGVVFSVIAYFRTHPKRQLVYSFTSKPLITRTDVPKLEVRVGGEGIGNPHFAEFRIRSTSRADIPSTMFDDGKPIRIQLESHSVLISSTEDGIETSAWETDGWSYLAVEIYPQLIKRGATVAFSFVSGGEATFTVDAPLVDVKVKQSSDRRWWQVLADPARLSVGFA